MESGSVPAPVIPWMALRKETLLKVIDETEEASNGARLIFRTATVRRWRTEEFIGSFDYGVFMAQLTGAINKQDFETIRRRIRNRDLLPIVGMDKE